MTPVMSTPAFLKKPLSIETPYGAPDGSALYWVTRISSAIAGHGAAAQSAETHTVNAAIEVLRRNITTSLAAIPSVPSISLPQNWRTTEYYHPPGIERECGLFCQIFTPSGVYGVGRCPP